MADKNNYRTLFYFNSFGFQFPFTADFSVKESHRVFYFFCPPTKPGNLLADKNAHSTEPPEKAYQADSPELKGIC